jgi:hypothetical protein
MDWAAGRSEPGSPVANIVELSNPFGPTARGAGNLAKPNPSGGRARSIAQGEATVLTRSC